MGQTEDKNGYDVATKGQINPQELSRSELIEYVIKKVERISQALYILTGYLPAEEPFRRNVREKALSMIDDLYHLQVDHYPQSSALSRLVALRFNELGAVLTVGVNSGLMSEMNYQVLMSEMNNLKDLVATKLSETKPRLDDGFFKTTLSPPADQKDTFDKKTLYKSSWTPSANKFSDPDKAIPAALSSHTNQDSRADNTAASISSRRRHGSNHSKRRRSILELFRDHQEITINEVQEVIEGCSQKTMQRELKSMVDDGLLEKHGKRRWSSYVLAKSVDLNQELD